MSRSIHPMSRCTWGTTYRRVSTSAALAAVLTIFGAIGGTSARTGPATGTMRIGDTLATVELPVGADAVRQGLSERDAVAPGTDGMFFRAFGQPGFGMEGMRFCLDFVWIAGDAVIGVTEDGCPAPTGGETPVFYPPGSVTAVVEAPAGWVADRGIAAGDAVSLPEVSARMVGGMVKAAARNGRFDRAEIDAVGGALAFAGADPAPIAAKMAAANDGRISAREVRRIRNGIRRRLAATNQGAEAPDRRDRNRNSVRE